MKKLRKFPFSEFVMVNGRYFPIVHRKLGKGFNCLYCDELHEHGNSEGPRIAHCTTGKQKRVLVNSDESIICTSDDGYYIVNI
jgi:hypothetical protein